MKKKSLGILQRQSWTEVQGPELPLQLTKARERLQSSAQVAGGLPPPLKAPTPFHRSQRDPAGSWAPDGDAAGKHLKFAGR